MLNLAKSFLGKPGTPALVEGATQSIPLRARDIKQVAALIHSMPEIKGLQLQHGLCSYVSTVICYRIFEEFGFYSHRVWAYPSCNLTDRLQTLELNGISHRFRFHVAPSLPMKMDNNIVDIVFDPLLSKSSFMLKDWAAQYKAQKLNIRILPFAQHIYSRSLGAFDDPALKDAFLHSLEQLRPHQALTR